MTWFVCGKGRCISCAETGRALFWQDGEWFLERDEKRRRTSMREDYALAMLAALGHRWDSSAIVPLAPPATPGAMTLAPVDLSQPANGGHYLAWDDTSREWRKWKMVAGELWGAGANATISAAYPWPTERPQ